MKIIVQYFDGMSLDEQARRVEKIFNSRGNGSATKALNRLEFGNVLIQFMGIKVYFIMIIL